MIATLARSGDELQVHHTTVAVPKRELVSSIFGGSTMFEVEGQWDTMPGIQIKLELWHPKSQRGRKVDLSLSVEEATQLLVALRTALREARQAGPEE